MLTYILIANEKLVVTDSVEWLLVLVHFNNAIYFPHKPEAGEEAHATYKDTRRLY